MRCYLHSEWRDYLATIGATLSVANGNAFNPLVVGANSVASSKLMVSVQSFFYLFHPIFPSNC